MMNILSFNNLNIKSLLLQFAMKQFSIVRSVCILLLSYFLLPCALFAQTTLPTLRSGDTLALFSNNYYIIDNNNTLSGSNSNLTTTALWIVENNKLKNLSTNSYMRYNNGYTLTSTSNQSTSISKYNESHWYIGVTGNNNKSYYRPSVSSGSISAESYRTRSTTDKNFKLNTQAIKITTTNFEASRTTEGGNLVYGEETTKVNEGTLSFSIPYTGGSCGLGNIVEVVKTKPYTQVGGTTTIVYDAYYVSSNESIKILKGKNVSTETEKAEDIKGEETETLTPTSFSITPSGSTIDGYSIKGTSVILPLNTTSEQRTAKFNVKLTIDGKDYTRTVTVTQAANNSGTTYRTFSHKVGQANAALGANGLQQVHTSEQVVYALDGEEKHLKLQVSSSAGNYIQGFHRWFNYDNDATVNSGLSHEGATYNYTANAKGVYIYGDVRSGETYYTMQGTDAIKIACDVAQYGDYNVTNTSIVEPTLSYRMVYDIRPASEMAALLDKCTSEPLETYNILAPAGKTVRIGPKYRWAGGEDYVNYYYTSGGYIKRLDSYQWYEDNSAFSVGTPADNRLIEVESPAAGQTAVYELRTTTGLIIARFNITSQAASSIGPSTTTLKSNAELDKAYDLKAYRNFDFADESGQMYSKPLPWDESTYGFTYSTGVAGPAKFRNGFPDWSEYALIKNTDYWNKSFLQANVRDHSNNGNGYFLYIDANEVSGKIADLKIDGDLCPNTSIWVSAWFVDAGNSNEYPNLNFIVTGIDASGNEAQILTYTTGTTNVRGRWQQVLFEVKLDEREFVQYRLRIDNNGASAAGNDFGIDDIRIYTSKPAVMGIQAMKACSSNETSNIAVLRVDYNRPGVMSNSHMAENIYYRWLQQDGTSVLPLNYIGGNSNYGKVSVNTSWTTEQQITSAGKNYYESLNYFLKNVTIPAEDSVEFYTIEDVKYEDGTTKRHPVLYIVHNSEKFVVNKKYEAQTMPYEPDFSKAECTSKYVFDVRPRARILVDGVEQNTTLLQNLNIGTYTLSVRTFGNNVNSGALEYTDCPSDWIIITNDVNSDKKADYIAELLEFREAFPSGNNAANLANYKLLKDLYDRGNLKLSENSLPVDISKRGVPTVCVAVPLESASTDKFQICPTPLEVVLRSEVFIVLANPADKESFEQMPAAVQGSHCIIRIPESKVKEALPSMDIDFINTDLLSVMSTDIQDHLFRIVLCETNDAEYQDEAATHNFQVYTLVPDNKSITHVNQLKVDDLLHAELLSGVNFNMKPGKYYNFHSVIENVNGREISPAFNFDVYVVPNTVVWSPKFNSTAWHNDDNWQMTDGSIAFVPLSTTNVIIKGDVSSMPMLSSSVGTLEDGANQYLKYDVGTEFNVCNNIYFGAFAELGNQQTLTYNKAYVDLGFDKNSLNEWEMLSMPLAGVVRGDFYIPLEGDGAFSFVESVAKVDNRFKNVFRMKAYNSAISNTIVNEEGEQEFVPYEYAVAEWSQATNVLNMELEVARGYAFSRSATTNQNFVRLPKLETTYYTYYKYNDGSEIPLMHDNFKYDGISRVNANKLVYDKRNASGLSVTLRNEAAGQFFLVGNPFMANLDVKKFLSVNTQFYAIFCYQYVDGAIQGTNLVGPNREVLRPMRAMFVQAKSNITETTVRFTPDMIADGGVKVPSRNKLQQRALIDDWQSELLLTAEMNGAVARSVIVENSTSVLEYDANEDAQLFVLDAELTPIGLYTVASEQAVIYNQVPDVLNIPISVFVLDSTRMGETFKLTFDGVDNFAETLYLYDSYYDTMLPLIDGLTLELEMPKSKKIRYYITRETNNDGPLTGVGVLEESAVVVISNRGEVTILAEDEIKSIVVYDIAGRKIFADGNVDALKYQMLLPQGVYMVYVETEMVNSNQKVVIK